jgi:hypothetical protein
MCEDIKKKDRGQRTVRGKERRERTNEREGGSKEGGRERQE